MTDDIKDMHDKEEFRYREAKGTTDKAKVMALYKMLKPRFSDPEAVLKEIEDILEGPEDA